jgi:hypothetical protein
VGGNDVGFGEIVAWCVLHPQTPSCIDAIAEAKNILENEIQQTLLGAYQELQRRIIPEAHVLVIGYAQFWNAVTDQCDEADWGILKSGKMDKARRDNMNKLTLQMNEKIEAAVNQLGGSRFIFINPDPFFEGHRFCEEGITEPQRKGDQRPDLFVHKWYTPTEQFDGSDLESVLDGPWNDIADVIQEEIEVGSNEPTFSSNPRPSHRK